MNSSLRYEFHCSPKFSTEAFRIVARCRSDCNIFYFPLGTLLVLRAAIKRDHDDITKRSQSGPEMPSRNLVLSYEKNVWWGHVSGGSMTTTYYIIAPTAKISSPTSQIQKLVQFIRSKHALFIVYT